MPLFAITAIPILSPTPSLQHALEYTDPDADLVIITEAVSGLISH